MPPKSLAGWYKLKNWLFRGGVHHAPGDVVELCHEDAETVLKHGTAESHAPVPPASAKAVEPAPEAPAASDPPAPSAVTSVSITPSAPDAQSGKRGGPQGRPSQAPKADRSVSAKDEKPAAKDDDKSPEADKAASSAQGTLSATSK
jgi:hypothetical protein